MGYMTFGNMPFIAIIGDIVSSKTISDRAAVQQKLGDVLQRVNSNYEIDIASKFMITLGDEFQGLLKNGTHAAEMVECIERALHPVCVRFGIGVGEITTQIDPEHALGADGPAYYNARKAVNALKSGERKRMEPPLDIRIEVEDHPDIMDILNTIFALNTALKSRWAERQREVIAAYLDGGGTQSEVAAKLGIHQSNVQKALSRANFYTYQKAIQTVSQILSGIKGPEEKYV